MMWVLMCVVAIVVGLMLYGKIEDKLPEQLRLPKAGQNKGDMVTGDVNQATAGSAVALYASKWQARGDGHNVELVRDFDGRIEVGSERYDAPTLVLTCYEGQVYAHVDLRMPAKLNGDKATVRTSAGSQVWSAGQGHDIYSPTPRVILDAVRAEQPFRLTLPYEELGNQTVTFTPKDGRKALEALPAECR